MILGLTQMSVAIYCRADWEGLIFPPQNSNIVELFSMLKKDDRDQQMCYYQVQRTTHSSSNPPAEPRA